MPPHHHQNQTSSLLCTRTHQILYLFIVSATFFLTRLIDRFSSLCSPHPLPSSDPLLRFSSGGDHVSLKLYVYEEAEIDGLRPLLYGRDGKITAADCVKGQWGTQVKIHKLFLKSRFRTKKKEEADFFFVPTYVKCVRMMGGLNDKEINQTFVKAP